MKFLELTEFFNEAEKTRSRNAITEMLAEIFKKAAADEIKPLTYLLMGKLGPLYQQVDLGLADKMVLRAIALSYGEPPFTVLSRFKEKGDLGEVAQELSVALRNTTNEHLSVIDMYQRLIIIARENGQGSQERKVRGLVTLLTQATPQEAKYIIRLVLSKMRLGFSDKTMLDALSVMERGSKQGREVLDQAYQVMPDIGYIAQLVKAHGIQGIDTRVQVTLGIPVMPALAQRLRTAKEMIVKMGRVMVEPKFDGTRVQIHIQKQEVESENRQNDWRVKTFTRNLEETTWMFPELETVLNQIHAQEVILDSEAVGIHPKTGKMLPFQMTITRKRKYGVDEAAINVPLRFFVFDILYKDGESFLHTPLRKRRKLLESVLTSGPAITIDEAIETDDPVRLREYHADQLRRGLEGVVVKQIDSPYEPGRRGWSWVKFKEVEESNGKLADTIDAVVMGFYRGQGKRSSFGIGAFLVGIRETEGDNFLTIAKIGTGLSDEQWKELKRRLESALCLDKPQAYIVDKGLLPDVWVEPGVVVEIAADEITTSPIHSAGYALRFPRLIRFRDDKNIGGVTTKEELLVIKGS